MRRSTIALVIVGALLIAALPASAEPRPDAAARPEFTRVIVELDPAGPRSRAFSNNIANQFNGRVAFVFEHAVNGFVAELPRAAIDALERNPNVLRVTPDRIVVRLAEQETPTGYDRTEADLVPRGSVPLDPVCPAGESCTDVDIAILDTGINAHPDLNVVDRTDCSLIILPGFGSCQDQAGFDGNGHGTHVAGTAAAYDNGIGVVGIAPGARLHSVKVLADSGTGYLGGIIAGVDWVTARAATIDVVNMSLSGEFDDPTLNTAIANSVGAGITYAVAAGNSSQDAALESPAKHPDVITVSAVADADGGAGGLSGFRCRNGEVDETLASFSNFGSVVEIAAPGVCILSTANDGGYTTKSGTSMASPHVAGAAALYIAMNGRDLDASGQFDKGDADAVRTALIADGHDQADACGFGGDTDGFPEPMLYVNGPAFGGDGVCEQEPIDTSPPSVPDPIIAIADGYPIQLDWTLSVDPESEILNYRIYRDTVPTSGEILLATAAYDSISYLDRSTDPATTYTYQVEAVNLQFGESGRSGSAQATTSADDPADAGWWTFDDGAGSIATDSTAWRRPGTVQNGSAWITAGRIGGALTLDGADDRVDLDTSVIDGQTDITFATWIRTTKTGAQTLISGANSSNDNEFLIQLVNDTTLRFHTGYTANTGVQWSMPSIADGQWHHLTVIRNNTLDQVWAYRDGASIGGWGLTVAMEPVSIAGLVVGQDQDSVMGGFQASEAVAGELDETRLYTRLLTQTEIDEISERDFTPPIGPDSLDATAATGAVDIAWTAASDPESGISAYQLWRDNGSGGAKSVLATLPAGQLSYRDTTTRTALTYAYEVVAINNAQLSGPASPEASATSLEDSSLVGWWALDDATGTTVSDWSLAGRDGTLAGGPLWATGRYNGGLSFDGTDDLVDLNHTVLDGSDDVTVSLWFKTTKTGIQALVSGANAGNDAEYELFLLSNPDLRLRFYTGEANVTYVWWPLPTAADGKWHHLAVVRDGSNDLGRLYFDGVDLGSRSAVLDPLDLDPNGLVLGQDQDVVGGGFDSSQAFVGTMDEVRIYDKILSGPEVLDLAGLGQPTPDVTAPDVPLGLVATAGDGQVSLDWDDHGEAGVTFTVYRSLSAGGSTTAIASGLTASDHVDVTVVNGTEYFYVVTASDTVGNESGVSSHVSATPTAPPVEADVAASSEATVVGTISANDLFATGSNDGVAEQLTESHNGGPKPRRVSDLDHRWTFQIGSPYQVTAVIDAYWPANTDGDDFAFEYSADGTSFSPISGVTAADDGAQMITLPGGLTGTITIRVVDTDATQGNASLDSVLIDQLVLRTVTGGTGTPFVTVTATQPIATEAGSGPGQFTVTRSSSVGPLTVGVGLSGTGMKDSDYQTSGLDDDSASSGWMITFVDGQTTAVVSILPIDDLDPELTEAVILSVLTGSGYDVGSPSSGQVTITDNDQPTTDHYAQSETTSQGSQSGSLANTTVSDGVYQVISEEGYAGNKRTRLEHTWTFSVSSGTNVTFNVEAFRSAGGPDNFVFAYSLDGATWTDMITINNTTDPNATQSYSLPVSTSGNVLVRVTDTDRSRGDAALSSVSIDSMFIRTD